MKVVCTKQRTLNINAYATNREMIIDSYLKILCSIEFRKNISNLIIIDIII